MSAITSYLNNNYYYKREQWVSNNSGASGCSAVGGASNTSGIYNVSGASGASGSYQWVSIGTVENLTINKIIDCFTHGNLTRDELEKWLKR